MHKTDFRRLFRYSDNCWSLLGETLATVPHASETWNTRFDTTSQWNTVRLLLAHSIGAEERLITLQNYHRGQVVMALQRLGFDPPNFDYVLLKEL